MPVGNPLRTTVALAGTLAALACSPHADDDPGPGDGRIRDDAGDGVVDPGADDGTIPDVADPDVRTEVPDHVSDAVCGEEDLPLEYNVSSDVLIVLDRSGSMMLSLASLKNAVNAIAGASDDRIWFGLMPFPNSVAPGECRLVAPATECAPPTVPHVEPGPLRAPEIAGVLGGIAICGSTPTSRTLGNARSYLRGAPTGHTQYVLLATDGVPNCNGSLDPATCTCLDTDTGCAGRPEACLDDAATYAALDALLADGILTYVIGMGRWMGTDRDVMDAMAVHGGTGHFYPAEDPSEILGVFEEIMGTIVVSCIFDLHPPPEADPTEVNLYVGGARVPRDTSRADGWDYIDEDTVEFYGPACDEILAGDVSGVGASYGCPTVFL